MQAVRRKWKGQWRPAKATIGAVHRGMTLIELLVVIVILSLVTAAALPVLTPSTTERRIRETSREFNTLCSQQKSNAIRTGRLSGIALKRLSFDTGNADDRGVCVEVVPVEQPAPYAGFDENSRIRVALDGPGVRLQLVTRSTEDGSGPSSGLPVGWGADLVPSGVIRVGDVVETLGTRYRIIDATNVSNTGYVVGSNDPTQGVELRAIPVNNTGQILRPVYNGDGTLIRADALGTGPYWTEPSPYKILRQPTSTSAPPLQLPNGIAIDLESSGILGSAPFHWAERNPVDTPIYIMFTPDGNVERVQYQYLNGSGVLVNPPIAPVSNIALLVGRREQIPASRALPAGNTETELETDKALRNWLNLESRWIAIGAQTGTVTTSENAFVDTVNLNYFDVDGDGNLDALDQRRLQIQAAQEFVREMRRTGGS